METQTAVVVEPKQEKVAPRTYYSRATGLVIRISKGERVRVGEQLERVGEKILEFSPMGAGQYGQAVTDDPEAIAILEARAELPGSDVMTAQQFNDQLIPDKDKISALQKEEERKDRTIAEQNRIIAELQKNQRTGPIKQ